MGIGEVFFRQFDFGLGLRDLGPHLRDVFVASAENGDLPSFIGGFFLMTQGFGLGFSVIDVFL